MRRCTSRFRRVRSRFVLSINSDHRRPPQHTRNGGSPALRLRMYGHIDTALGRPLRLLSFSLRDHRGDFVPVRFYLSAVITPVTGIEN